MKKLIILVCVTVLLSSVPVLAAGSPSAEAVVASNAPAPASNPAPYVEAGFNNAGDSEQATSRGLSAGEFYNNAVSSVPGVENVMPVGQGGKILINGVATNLAATLAKVSNNTVTDAKSQAETLGGTLFNVMDVSLPKANFLIATINFYVKGLAGDTKVAVKQLVDGVWVDVEIVEVRLDHVILNLTQSGPVAFIQMPADSIPLE